MTQMEANFVSAGELGSGAGPAHRNVVAAVLAILGASMAWALAPFANGKPSVAAAMMVSPIILLVLLGLPTFQCLRLGPRLLLILLALRPLVDVSAAAQTGSSGLSQGSSAGISLQDIFAGIFGFLLLAIWIMEGRREGFKKAPNVLLLLLLGLTSLSWLIGSPSAGVNGFARTAWGLLVALLLGSFFRTERQIEVFAGTVFYSSIFFFLILSMNLGSGFQTGEYWRLGGQYTYWSSLARVCFSFFVYGLYVVGSARTGYARWLSLTFLVALGTVIVLTQERTVGGLMLISVCLYLWASRRRWLLYGVIAPLLVFLFVFTAGTGWRLVSSFSLAGGQDSATVMTLTGRFNLWSDWLKFYLQASLFHKVFGIGWGNVIQHFATMGYFGTSITESSYMWFFIGAGVLGLLAFVAYLVWVLFQAWKGWRKASNPFDRHLSLLAFLVALAFIIEGLTNDLAISPNASVYLYAAMSIFMFRWLQNTAAPPTKRAGQTTRRVLRNPC